MQMKKVKEVLETKNTENREEKKITPKKTMMCAKTMFALSMAAFNITMLVNPVFAQSTDGSELVTNSLALLFSIVAAFISSFGGLQVLWGVFEWGNATNTQDGMMQSMSIRRIGGGLVQTIAPQIVTALIGS